MNIVKLQMIHVEYINEEKFVIQLMVMHGLRILFKIDQMLRLQNSTSQKCRLGNMKDSTCVPGEENQDGSITCTTRKTQMFRYLGYEYIQKYSQCEAVDVSTCSIITHVQICLLSNLTGMPIKKYVSSFSDYETQDICSFIRLEYLGNEQMCAWCNNKCIEANNIQISESSTCYYSNQKKKELQIKILSWLPAILKFRQLFSSIIHTLK